MHPEKVAILDAGAQYGKVIDRRVRELNIRSDILPLDSNPGVLKGFSGIIISGGPESVYDPSAPKAHPKLFEVGVPILGICYGMQLMNYALGGGIERKQQREDGQYPIDIVEESAMFKGLSSPQQVLLTHGDSIERLAPGFRTTALSGDIVAAIDDPGRKLFGVQFHPEVDLTENGTQMLRNFLYDICGCTGDFQMENREEEALQGIIDTVGDSHVLVLVSGGVDSTVCAALVAKAIPPEHVHALHIDTGFMRKNESAAVRKALAPLGVDLRVVDASKEFFSATTEVDGKRIGPLGEVRSPEEKRKIIGDTFIRVAQQHLDELSLPDDRTFLAQGTLRPDLIESASEMASARASTIKTHHNDTALVRELRRKGKVIEPLKDLHKDEVRELGHMLGLPNELVERQPFPGPGLAVRVLCTSTSSAHEELDAVRARVQKFSGNGITATVLPVRTVGVQGDGRSYCLLACLSGEDRWPDLLRTAKEIPRQVHQVNRVVYAFGGCDEGQVTDTRLSQAVVSLAREADAIVQSTLRKAGVHRRLSQVPVIVFPADFGEKGKRSIALRPFITRDFMTGLPAVPGKDIPLDVLSDIVSQLRELPGVARVVYDLTAKPPGTTEWE